MTWQNPIGPNWQWPYPGHPWIDPQPKIPPTTTTWPSRTAFDVFEYELFAASGKEKLYGKIKEQIDLDDSDSVEAAAWTAAEIRDAFKVANEVMEKIEELEDKYDSLQAAKSVLMEYLDETEYNEKVLQVEEQLNDLNYRLKNLEKAMAEVMISYGLTVQNYSEPRKTYDYQVNW